MLLLPYNITDSPFASFIAHFDGDESLSLGHYDSGKKLFRIVDHPGLTRPDIGTVHLMLDALQVAKPASITIRDWYPPKDHTIPEWILCHEGDGAHDLILHLHRPTIPHTFLASIIEDEDEDTLHASTPIFDSPPVPSHLTPILADAATEAFTAAAQEILGSQGLLG